MRNLYINFNKNIKSKRKIKHIELVSGNVVLGCDAFKSFVESLKSFFGGNIASLESVLDRGRREALLRMREKAYLLGAHIVTNVKIETIVLDPLGTEKGAKVSVMAYGTAIKYVQN